MSLFPSFRLPRPARLALPEAAAWVFAVRTAAAGLLALFAAFALGLNEPQWAIMTVYIVSQPFTGMVLAKGFYRAAGTLAGAAMAVLLVALLGRHEIAFLVAMAGWLALCTFVSGLLRNAESYGAVLAGYTAGIIAYPALDAPGLLGEFAIARCTEILLGMLCAGAASALVFPRRIRPVLHDRLRDCIAQVAAYAADALDGADVAALHDAQRRLIAETQALDALRAYALLESPGLRARSRQVRHVLGYVLSAMSAARMLHDHVAPDLPALHGLFGQAAGVLRRIGAAAPVTAAELHALAEMEALISARQAALAATPGPDLITPDLIAAAALTGLSELFDALAHAIAGLVAVTGKTAPPAVESWRRGPFATHRDPFVSLRNGVRAGIAALAVSLLWRLSHWSEGANTVVIVAALTGLFAAQHNAVESSMTFFRGTAYAVPVAFLCGQFLLPDLPGYGWLAAILLPILVVSGLGMAQPRHVGVATGFAVMFLAMLAPRPAMAPVPWLFLDAAGSVLVGTLLCAVVFLFVLPTSPWRATRHMLAAMRADLARLCTGATIPGRLAFESRMYDRINLLLPSLPTTQAAADTVLGASLGALTLGLEVLRLRHPAGAWSAPRRALLESLLRRLATALTTPPPPAELTDLVAAARDVAAALASPDAQAAGAQSRGHLPEAAALRVIAATLADHPTIFARLA